MRSLLAFVILCGLSPSLLDAARWPRVRMGGLVVNAGYRHWGSYWGPGYGYGWVDPFLFGFSYASFSYASGKGEIKLAGSLQKDAQVFIDGGFAGTAGDLKSMWLSPGAYQIEVRGPDGPLLLQKRVYVLSGKVLRLR